jgi:beta-fructofuranosidase
VEIFIGDGEYVLTGRVYPGMESTGIRAFASGKCTMVSFQKWDILT